MLKRTVNALLDRSCSYRTGSKFTNDVSGVSASRALCKIYNCRIAGRMFLNLFEKEAM